MQKSILFYPPHLIIQYKRSINNIAIAYRIYLYIQAIGLVLSQQLLQYANTDQTILSGIMPNCIIYSALPLAME